MYEDAIQQNQGENCTNTISTEETLDPSDWETMRDLGHQMVDDAVHWLRTIRHRPVWRPIPAETKQRLRDGVPESPQTADEVYADFKRDVLPYPYGNPHPRFWAWVNGNGDLMGVFADMLASLMNPNVTGLEDSASHVETQVIDWLRVMLDFPESATGLLTSGASYANLIALAVARNTMAPVNVRSEGLFGQGGRLVLYTSRETHSSIAKAAELLGLGSKSVRSIHVDDAFRIDVAQLEDTIRRDRDDGMIPFCIVGTAGTVNTGATDDLDALADLAERERLWLHVDGAFGALAWLVDDARPQLAGLQRADSLAFDLHKWLYAPVDVGCVLLRDAGEQRATFELMPAYLTPLRGGLAAGPTTLSNGGLELTRRFRALKLWMAIKHHGVGKYRRLIAQNIEQARYLADRVEAMPSLELLAPVPLNVVNFRYVTPSLSGAELFELNRELLVRLQESGEAVPSSTVIDGSFAIRVAITNHRSQRRDFDRLVEAVTRLGDELTTGNES
jgi:glutamate/tyrosine decarboxylase-like PLP-dependent enzyme